MNLPYETELNFINSWIDNVNAQFATNSGNPVYSNNYHRVGNALQSIASYVRSEYPFYSQELLRISNILFGSNTWTGVVWVNAVPFGEIVIIIKHITNEPLNMRVWHDIHPRIVKVAKDRFVHSFYSDASERAIKEVESRMRELFRESNSSGAAPKHAADLIGALLSDKGTYHFCDTTEVSGRNFRQGIMRIFEGAFLAYRNPAMHENLECSQREAIERIVQASQMMYILTSGEVKT